jgi:hypothetical protein
LKTIILQRQYHPEYRLIVWFANTRAIPSAVLSRGLAARTPKLGHLLAPLTPKTSEASFCSVAKIARKGLPGAGDKQP